MGKGVLLELNGRNAVVLTPQGEFKQVPAPRGAWEIGDEIEYTERRPAPIWQRWGAAAAAAAVLLLAPLGYQSWSLAQPVAVVTVEINPGFEFTVNKRAEVVQAKSLNADGQLVLSGINWKKKPVEQVVAEATARAIEQQKLDPADDYGAVVVAVAPAREKLSAAIGANVVDKTREAVSQVISEHAVARKTEAKAHVMAAEVTAVEKQEARVQGLNPSDLIILKALQEQSIDVDPQELVKKGPGKLLHELGINPALIFSNEQSRKSEKENKDNAGKGSDKGDDAQPASGKPDDRNQPGAASDDNSGKGKGQDKADEKEPKQNSNNASGNGKGKEKDQEKEEENWNIPILDLKIPKPSFLQGSDKSPRVDLPGAGSPAQPKDKPSGDDKSKPGGTAPGNSGKSGDAGSNGSDKVGNNSQGNAGQKTGVPGAAEKEKEAAPGNKKGN